MTDDTPQQRGPHLYSPRYDDHYASRADPLREKQVVFCDGNDLAARFPAAGRFTIGELGFGTGLSFLVTVRLWRATRRPGARLDFVSCEAHPLSREQLRAALAPFAPLAPLAERLVAKWPPLLPGWHRLEFPDWGVTLTLLLGDARHTLPRLAARVDAWFLDGFAPARNPALWEAELLRTVARLSRPGATFATYTAAGQVRRDLQAAGFTVEKRPGFGGKRERLVGRIDHPPPAPAPRQAWAVLPAPAAERRVTVLGAGLAGCAVAERLAARGWAVSLVDRAGVAGGTSANPAAIINPFFSRDDNAASRLSRQGYLYTLHTLARLRAAGLDPAFHTTGVYSLARSDDDLALKGALLARFRFPEDYLRWVTAPPLPGLAARPGFHLPGSGWLDMGALCRALCAAGGDGLRVHTATVTDVERRDGLWRLRGAPQVPPAPVLVVATGPDLAGLGPTRHLPLTPNRGQLSRLHAPGLPALAVAGGGYAVGDGYGALWFGSTYAAGRTDAAPDARSRRSNRQRLARLFPALAEAPGDWRQDWAGIRATTPDRLPLAGPVLEADAFRRQWGPLLRGERRRQPPPVPFQDGLFVLGGLGSRAMTYGLLAAELLASLLDGNPLPVDRPLGEALHPGRFLARALRRGLAHPRR